MVNTEKYLHLRAYIPTLQFTGKRAIKTGDNYTDLPTYRLDWNGPKEHKKNEYWKWANSSWINKVPVELRGSAPADLPPALDAIVTDLQFAVPDSYTKEIDHFVQLYLDEAMRERPFDTVVRDMCGRVRVHAMNSAFKLLADCMFNPQEAGWLRNILVKDFVVRGQRHGRVLLDKHILQCLLMYKFWRGQPGRAMVWEYAEFNKLKDWSTTAKFSNKHPLAQKSNAIDTVCDMIHAFENDEERFWEFVNVVSGEVDDGSIRDLPPGELDRKPGLLAGDWDSGQSGRGGEDD